MKSIIFVFAVLFVSTTVLAQSFNLKEQAESYRLRYGLRDPNSKLVNDHGDGYENLYGLRNFRVVLEVTPKI
jgi:hypothetical protein